MKLSNTKFLSSLAATTLFALILVSILGELYFIGMAMNFNGKMDNCIFMTSSGTCMMGLNEHLTLWQEMFAATSMSAFSINCFISVISLTIIFGLITFGLNALQLYFKKLFYSFHLKKKYYLSFFDYLKHALFKGILNPKIYSLVVA